MRLFACSHCSSTVFFDNSACVTCGSRLGFHPGMLNMTALASTAGGFVDAVHPEIPVRLCANAQTGACNWLIEEGESGDFCRACRHNLTIPNLDKPENVENWQRIEAAKRNLFYSLIRFGLRAPTRAEDAEHGLAFEFLSDDGNEDGTPVLTGHAEGVITLNIAEGSDAEREARRVNLGEPFRTLIGHFRHEIGHYYWDRLIRDRGRIDDFRAVFGDESRDYGEALQAYYKAGAPAGWDQSFISTYATSHPWEDFAETWAHYFHMVDALETAHAYGLRTDPRTVADDPALTRTFDSYRARDIGVLADAWIPLTLAVNSINRSMGQRDLYPFVLSDPIVAKLGFVHGLIHQQAL